ncbi:uncharacterized protein SCHCODRAFT_01088127 [Schizophyllum commune H4-8]|nr:uncharacterized protein SCHCODRAFT_01088127 [Schizophyllum commune H4-8]KAI5894823.1 hypothetical protein SCHCODRAFT_01088127 [Schizophyllum commune H4-8]
MKLYVNDILVPYFSQAKKELGLPETQRSIWRIDCWSVHCSEEFLTWMKTNHTNITIIFVPSGCTGIFQPLDVGIQRVLKHSMRKAAHKDLVKEASEQIEAATSGVKLDTRLPVLRDYAVRWMVQAYHDITPELR